MQYALFHLITGEAHDFILSLQHDVANKFGITGATRIQSPPHLRLKNFFEVGDVLKLEALVEKFCSTNTPAPYVLEGFGSFGHDVIYIDVIPTNPLQGLRAQLHQRLRKESWVQWSTPFDGIDSKLHASVAHTDIREEIFSDVWNFVNQRRPYFECQFDNIVIVTKDENEARSVCKEFSL